jgi:hypothetical protein
MSVSVCAYNMGVPMLLVYTGEVDGENSESQFYIRTLQLVVVLYNGNR